MKKSLFLILFSAATFTSSAQWINSLQVVPANPTSADTVRIYAACSFPSGPCDLDNQISSVSGNTIYGYARHCMGMLAFICSSIDTFIVPPLSPGNYTFLFSLDAGLAPATCTPGIVPGPQDSLQFTVTLAAGLPPVCTGPFGVQFDSRTGVLNGFLESPAIVYILSVDGKLIRQYSLPAGASSRTLHCPAGIYLARLSDSATIPVKFVITR